MAVSQLTITYAGSDKILTQITEGNYTSVYRLRESLAEFLVNVRHSTEKAVGGARPLERHNMELSVRTFPTADRPLGFTETAYIVVRSDPDSDGGGATDVSKALASYVYTNAGSLIDGLTTLP